MFFIPSDPHTISRVSEEKPLFLRGFLRHRNMTNAHISPSKMPKNVSDDLQLGASIPISASEAVKFYPLKITPHNILTRRKIFVGNHAKKFWRLAVKAQSILVHKCLTQILLCARHFFTAQLPQPPVGQTIF